MQVVMRGMGRLDVKKTLYMVCRAESVENEPNNRSAAARGAYVKKHCRHFFSSDSIQFVSGDEVSHHPANVRIKHFKTPKH